ncbi:unnamed protein product [Linum trigynum]|uniref:RNase H type-1 domain-containing protein n=1 Tax=Linum trigynum TaxID=586398 RepID=A0AAV2EMI9_9ROSI
MEEQRWKPPMMGSVKLSVDVACFEGQRMGWGVVARDATGQFLFGVVKRSQIQWNPEEVESGGVLWAETGINRPI